MTKDVTDSQYNISLKHHTGSFILTDHGNICCTFYMYGAVFKIKTTFNFLRFLERMGKFM